MKSLWKKLHAVRHRKPKLLHEGHEYAHLAYFAAVFVGGHGVYAYVAGVLFLTGAMLLFFEEGEV